MRLKDFRFGFSGYWGQGFGFRVVRDSCPDIFNVSADRRMPCAAAVEAMGLRGTGIRILLEAESSDRNCEVYLVSPT